MYDSAETDLRKVCDAIQCIRQTLKCAFCHKLPLEAVAAKCGHPFCKTCVDKVLYTKKAVCSICKTAIIRSAVRSVESIDKIIKDFNSLSEAVEKDSGTNIRPDKPVGIRQYRAKRKSLTLPGPSGIKIKQGGSSKSELSVEKPEKKSGGTRSRAKKVKRQDSIDSEETIKIQSKKMAKKSDELAAPEPSTSWVTNGTFEPVSTADSLSVQIGSIGSKEKVKDWLFSEQFEDESRDTMEFSENVQPQTTNSSSVSEILQSFSQVAPNSDELTRSGRNSQASKASKKNEEGNGNPSTDKDKDSKFPSFTFKATVNKAKKAIPKPVTPAEQMFDELRKKPIDEGAEDKKSKVSSVTNDSSWSELARLKKETHAKTRKRRKLNVSIERPSSAKPVLRSVDHEDFEGENDVRDINKMETGESRNSGLNEETNAIEESPKKRQKPSLVSYRTLDRSEMIDVKKLNRRQVKEIIGVNLDTSKNSSNSADKSPIKSNNNKLSLGKSGEHSQNNNNDEERTLHFGENSRPQSKQSFNSEDSRSNSGLSHKNIGKPASEKNKLSLRRSDEHSRDNSREHERTSHIEEISRSQFKESFHPDDNRPGSRLSHNSNGKLAPNKFRLSAKKKSLTPNIGPLEISVDTDAARRKEEDQETIARDNDSPVRVCNDFIRNKLSLKNQKLSPECSKTTDLENRSSTNVSIKKMGKLYKPRNRIKFIQRGTIITSKLERNELQIKTRNVATQTSPGLANADSIANNFSRKHLSSESMAHIVIPETRAVSAASSDSKRIEEARIAAASSSSKIAASHESPEKFDTINKVNMLSPEKDSQLKYLDTKSPSVPRIGSTNSDESVPRKVKSCAVTRETSFTNTGAATPGYDEYLRAVKKKAEKLIVTDSEDQDTPNESSSKCKRRNNRQAERNGSDEAIPTATTSFGSKTTSDLSDMRMEDKTGTAANRDVININRSSSVHSVGNNSKGKLSYASPKRKRYLRGSFTSPATRRSAEKLKSLTKMSGSQREKSPQSDAERVLFKMAKHSEDSEASVITAKHNVVRKLKYSEESGSNPNTESGISQLSEQQTARNKEKKNNRILEQKTFQRIRRKISSSDSEDELLEISLTAKQSSTNSQTIAMPGPSREVNRSPILSEDMTVVFSSNKDTQESKRKRSPSPSSLDNNDLQAIASNWCADLDRSSEEIAVESDRVLGLSKNASLDGAPPKKPRVEAQGVPASSKSYKCPENHKVETAVKMNSQSSNNEESEFIDNLEEVMAQFEHPITKRGNTSSGTVTASKNSITIKAELSEDEDLSAVHGHSQNSDKENEHQNEGVKKRVENKEAPANTGQKIASNEDLIKLEVNCKYYEQSEAENMSKLNCRSVPGKTNSTNNTELFESSFDRDCLNITQEQILMQEVEDNLLGRKSKDTMKNCNPEPRHEKVVQKSPNNNAEKGSSGKEPANNNANQKPKTYQIGEIDSEDSATMDEDIIESTPEKKLPLTKDPYTNAENSQRLNSSLKSFMSVDMTPIPKSVPKHLLREPNSRSSSNNLSVSKNSSAHTTRHSTPKSVASVIRKINISDKSDSSKTVGKQERRLCFVCSCLTLPQVQKVKAFANKHNVEYTANYKPEVTHVIVETNERDSAGRTLKYLLGIAHKKWIVSYRWITDSINQNRILEEEDYEVVDSETEEPGPRRSRLSKKGLFDEFAFVCMQPFTDITVGQLQDLLSSTGGTVIQSLEELASVTNKHRVILYNSEIHQQDVLRNWHKKGSGLPVQVEWVLSCISQYELVSFRYYLQDLDPDLLSGLGLPPELIAEEEDSCSGNEVST